MSYRKAGEKPSNPQMEHGFFSELPSEMTIEILSRLPVGDVRSCKHVCKPWLNLLKTEEFAQSHLSKSVPGLIIKDLLVCVLVESEEELLDHDQHNDPPFPPLQLRMALVTSFAVSQEGRILCSVNGLLLLRGLSISRNCVSICNPVTREYIELHCPKGHGVSCWEVAICGFGVSQTTGLYKLVRVSHDHVFDQCGKMWMTLNPEATVYTLGTGTWRTVAYAPPFVVSWDTGGVLVNGKLHWLVLDHESCPLIYCFDLDAELFSTFAIPGPYTPGCKGYTVCALGDRLCLCDSSSREIVIWAMKEYGVESSWTKEYVIDDIQITTAVDRYTTVHPIKLLKGGEILMARLGLFLFYYCKKDKTVWRVDSILPAFSADLHTPSFLPLRRFERECVKSF